eukprot:TRINITY_DN13524_c0_g1_i1.p1 TRINITY_DN13524_c0_g1~~TRINITY_DN13524_c0_g1_i1.p1  ORF type:complete len:166 (-),score=15.66 TRINITY_DN13524_c0_g1_i1:145-642(-)
MDLSDTYAFMSSRPKTRDAPRNVSMRTPKREGFSAWTDHEQAVSILRKQLPPKHQAMEGGAGASSFATKRRPINQKLVSPTPIYSRSILSQTKAGHGAAYLQLRCSIEKQTKLDQTAFHQKYLKNQWTEYLRMRSMPGVLESRRRPAPVKFVHATTLQVENGQIC